ncbi:hypothetical protein BUALT_Bualt06G0073100 [Buddleja alternifolia]|uniref:Uncharacterized protein n=1 Tax=Buddleja alternifolia TaxID=168488 RepID=A0AAV6XK59_9LAMI|nr:hypothetical protein BUALT_Bualt06G0073100 [Buddleja alternifolia]
MEAVIDANAPLDYIEFLIFPNQNRYEVWVCYANKKEKVTSGLLEHLLLHSAAVKALHSKGSNAMYKLKSPENSDDLKWFTKSTLIRFLQIIGSANILDVTNSLKNEISQLEEARKFHLSLYAKGTEYQHQSGESVSSCSNSTGSTPEAEGSDASKNELMRAMDLRLTALREELSSAFDQAAGYRYSLDEMTDIEKFSHHFGSEDLRDSLQKHLEMRQRTQAVENSSSKRVSESDRVGLKEGNNHTTKSLSSETQVKYGVSPAKAAQVERQSSTESDESSLSSEEEQPSVERSRTLIRSASPRRSASPMRRIQIGRSGSRRSTAITIKSLNYIPAREKSFFPKDNDSDEEVSEQPPKKPENNVKRMSVQDAISLFESKQRDQTGDSQKAKSNALIGANKSVLRRWSSGMGDDSCVNEIQNNVESREYRESSPESEVEPRVACDGNPIDPCELDGELNSSENRAASRAVTQEETLPNESAADNEKLTASAEWSRQKEAELNELLMKMMETKPAKSQAVVPHGNKRQSLPAERRGGFYDNYKEKRDEKLRGEAFKNKAEKDKQFRAMQQILDIRKSQLTSANASDAGKKNNVKKIHKSQKNVSQPINPKTESPKLGVVKKASPKTSSLPATRKSWPSMPSPRAPGASPAKTPVATTSTGIKPTRRRSQPTPPVSQSSPRVETSQLRAKSVKPNQQEHKKSLRSATEKKQQPVAKPSKTVKSKVLTAPEDLTSTAKLIKVTKKSSVVPLESKPFLRKGSGTISNINPVVKKKALTNSPQESLKKSGDPFPVEKDETFSNSSVPVILQEERENEEARGIEDVQIPESPQKCEDKDEGFSQVNPVIDDSIDRVEEHELKAEDEEESTISPTAWVEIEEHDEDQHVTSEDRICQMVGSPPYAAPVRISSPRVRHSLSQMLLEETSEHDIVDWGNAENPPAMVYQKDAPKGLKRLLKFARKSKNDGNATGWSTPSVASEGEDDTEDSKIVNKRSAENLLKKATLHSMNNGHQKATYDAYTRNATDCEHPAQASIKSLSQQIMEGHVSSSVTTTKGALGTFAQQWVMEKYIL